MAEYVGIVGRYMKNNENGAIVNIIAFRRNGNGPGQVCYQARTRKAWVNRDRLKEAGEEGNRLNGYTLLPQDYKPEGFDVA
jgi:hypothetical protein